MKWGEVINPSDKTMICVDDAPAAAIAVLVVSNGAFALEADGETLMTMFLFGGDPAAWFKEKFKFDMTTVSNERIEAAAKTAQYGYVTEIESMQAALEDLPEKAKQKAWAKYQDKKRSSTNRIVDAFHSLKLRPREVTL